MSGLDGGSITAIVIVSVIVVCGVIALILVTTSGNSYDPLPPQYDSYDPI